MRSVFASGLPPLGHCPICGERIRGDTCAICREPLVQGQVLDCEHPRHVHAECRKGSRLFKYDLGDGETVMLPPEDAVMAGVHRAVFGVAFFEVTNGVGRTLPREEWPLKVEIDEWEHEG